MSAKPQGRVSRKHANNLKPSRRDDRRRGLWGCVTRLTGRERRSGIVRVPATPDYATRPESAEGDRNLRRGAPTRPVVRRHDARRTSGRATGGGLRKGRPGPTDPRCPRDALVRRRAVTGQTLEREVGGDKQTDGRRRRASREGQGPGAAATDDGPPGIAGGQVTRIGQRFARRPAVTSDRPADRRSVEARSGQQWPAATGTGSQTSGEAQRPTNESLR